LKRLLEGSGEVRAGVDFFDDFVGHPRFTGFAGELLDAALFGRFNHFIGELLDELRFPRDKKVLFVDELWQWSNNKSPLPAELERIVRAGRLEKP
jgi:hypothetical protein